MKKAHIDRSGKLLGWYDSDIHDEIPTPNVEVSEEEWQNAIDNGHNKVNKDGSTELFDFRTDAEKQADELSQKNADALSALNIGDWQVIRELERMFLKDTPLNIEREQLRESIV